MMESVAGPSNPVIKKRVRRKVKDEKPLVNVPSIGNTLSYKMPIGQIYIYRLKQIDDDEEEVVVINGKQTFKIECIFEKIEIPCSEYSSVSPISKFEKILSLGTHILLSKVKQSSPFFIDILFSCQPSLPFTYWFIGRASKNSFAIIIWGSDLNFFILDIHRALLFRRFSLCKVTSLWDFSKIVMSGSICLLVTV